MKTPLQIWQSAHTFIIKNFLIVLLIPLGIWALDEVPTPRPFPMASYDMAEEMVLESTFTGRGGGGAAPMMASSSLAKRSRSIMPEAMADDGFAEVADEDRKIIKNGNISLQVDDTEVARFEVEKKIKAMNGKIQNVNSWQVRKGILGYNLTVRVPAEKLEETLLELSKMGEKMSESINATDITRQYNDTENKLKNLRTRRERLRKMLEFDTKNLADVLSVDRELSSVQSQIENMQNMQNRRDTDVALSTLRISIQPIPQIGDINNPHWSITKSWRAAVNNLIQKSHRLFDWTLKHLVLAPIWLPALLILWWLKKKFWNRKKSAKK